MKQKHELNSAVSGATDAPRLSVIIVVWNVRELTMRCIRTLHENRDGVPFEVVLVDNGSVDGTVEAVRSAFPDTVIIENDQNMGFPHANNQGLAVARGEYVLFLNSDAFPAPGVLAECVRELDQDATIGMVGCRLHYEDGRTQYESARNPYLLRDLLSEVFYLHMLRPHSGVFAHHLMGDWDHTDVRDVEAISGAFMLARRSVAREVGGLPEEILMYHEDLAFCLRIRQRGWRILYRGDLSALHIANQTTNKNRLRWYLLEGEYKVRLIGEAQGRTAAVAARVVFGARSAVRMVVAVVGMLPGLGGVRQRYPKVFDVERHALHLAWAVWPASVRRLVPAIGNQQKRTAAVAATPAVT